MKVTSIIIAVLIIGSATGCASVYRGDTESITIKTPNCPNAKCTLMNKKGTWQVETPDAVTIPRSDDTLYVKCELGEVVAEYEVESTMDGGTVIMETLLWGPFAFINAGTDGHREYQDVVSIPMDCDE